MKMAMLALSGILGSCLLVLHLSAQAPDLALHAVARIDTGKAQEEQVEKEETRKPLSPQRILSAARDFQGAVNGKALVRNQCRLQGKDVEIEETSEVVETNKCELVVKTVKTIRAPGNPKDIQPVVQFMIHADLADLTTPILVETQRFAQCDSSGGAVLKVSSRSDPKKPVQVIRSSDATKNLESAKQTRRDLSLFFADPAAAKKAAHALDGAVKACGGKEWPDEDDLP